MRSFKLRELAEAAGGRVVGEAEMELTGVAPLQEAGPNQMGLLASAAYVDHLEGLRAGAVLVTEKLESSLAESVSRLVVPDAHAALVPILSLFHPPAAARPGIHPTAVLGRGVELGNEISIGAYAVLEEGSVVGDRCHIGPHVVIGQRCQIGEDTVLHAQVVLYPDTVLGRRVIVHSGARLGVDGFGFAQVDGKFEKIPQVGACTVGDDVEIGANCCFDRGSIGHTRVGSGTKIDNFVHLAHNARVGEHCVMAAHSGMAGSSIMGDHVMVGGQVGIANHLKIGSGARLAPQAGVIRDIEAGATVTGFPARDLRSYFRSSALFFRLPEILKRVRRLEAAAGFQGKR